MEAGEGAPEPPEPKGLPGCPWLPSTPRKPNSAVQHPIYVNRESNHPNFAESGLWSGASNPVPRRGIGQLLGDFAGNPVLRRELGQLLGDSAGNSQCQAAPASYTPANVSSNSVLEENLSSFDAWQASQSMADKYLTRDLSGVSFQTLMSHQNVMGCGSSAGLNVASVPTGEGSVPSKYRGNQVATGNLHVGSDCVGTSSCPADTRFSPLVEAHQYEVGCGNSRLQGKVSSSEATFGAGLNTASTPTGIRNHIATGERSVPCMPFDLNSSPGAMIADAAFEPITTPQRNNKGESSRGKEAEKSNITGDRVMEPNGNKEKHHRIIDQSSAGTSAQLQDVDFLKTPQPKARRKKHRPKVIIEGKKKSTPKSTAKAPSAHQEATRVKRKYVRKKGASNPSVEEINGIGLNNKGISSTKAPVDKSLDKEPLKTRDVVGPRHTRSCRKSLNFNLADEVGDESPSSSMNQLQEDNSPNMDPLIQTRGKCQILFSNDEETNTVQFSMNSGSQMTSKIMGDSIGSNACSTPERQVGGSKRRNMGTVAESEIWKRDEARTPYKFLQAYLPIFSQNAYVNNGSPGYHFPTIYRKKRTEKGQNMVASSSQQTRLTSENHTGHDIHSLGGSFAGQITSVTNQGSSSGQCQLTSLLCTNPGSDGTQNGRKMIRKKRSKIPTRPRNLASLLEMCGRLRASTNRAVTTSSMRQKITFLHERPTCMEALAANTRLTLAKKKRSKRRMVINSAVLNLYNHQKPTTTSMGPPLALTWRCMSPVDPVEYIVEKFNRLSLTEKSIQVLVEKRNAFTEYNTNYPEQHAIVPYQGSGVVVPFGGSFDQVKRKRPRAKVDLDDETNKVWKLLLENINSEGIDGTDEEKAKWWEEERRVFSGRANSFIARMHLVQGDRRFSEWKGSVCDSVMGVYLTQNVSDHLSSSAFISLAARFPVRSKTQSSDLHEVEIQAEEVCGLDPDVIFRLKNNIINQSDCGQVMSHETVANKSSSLIEDGRDAEDIFSSQNSSDSPVAQTVEKNDSCLPSTLEEPTADVDANIFNNSTSFVKLLQMADTVLHGVYEGSDKTISGDDQKIQPKRLKIDFQSEGHLTNHVFPPETIEPSGKSTLCYVPNSGSQGPVSDLSKQKGKFFNLNDNEEYPVDISGLSSESGSGTTFQKIMDVNFEGGPKSLSEHATSTNNGQGEINKKSQVPIPSLFQERQKMQGVSNSPVYQQNLMDIAGSSNNVDNFKNPERKEVNSSKNGPVKHRGKKVNGSKAKVDWDDLRKQTLVGGTVRAKTANRMDSVDWDAVRCADLSEISATIKDRGMNNMLSERMKDSLNRMNKDHGSTDLEWLRDVPPDKAKEYLLSFRGLGLKSVECVRLLTLHHLAFPVDTNVGRIAVRLGWVPLQPLPEALQLHLLEMYPVLESIQKYLWPRLCKLDQETLYELHYQMITFGKVFCTKRQPNCNACPMRGDCRHFASAFASARLALPAPGEKGIVCASENRETDQNPIRRMNTLQLPSPEANQVAAKYKGNNSQPIVEEPLSPEPIIEVPATPEHEYPEVSQCDIENVFIEDPDEIPTIKLNMEEFTHNLQKIMEQNTELEEGDMSKALVALTSGAASIPVPKLKNVNRLRTEHLVYELPDSHPLLEGMEKREPDDPSPYLLAIWTPGETADSIVPPERRCSSSHESEKLCTDEACSSCNSIRELNSQTVRGTILIPCRTAMRGSFPLNGTYFQVNELFSDHESSLSPINVPRRWLWNLPRRTVFFGSTIPTIFRGLTTEEIQLCFWRGFVCVRGFDRKTRAPRPLIARLHLPASKMGKGKGKKDES